MKKDEMFQRILDRNKYIIIVITVKPEAKITASLAIVATV
jgi:hypothetical protein